MLIVLLIVMSDIFHLNVCLHKHNVRRHPRIRISQRYELLFQPIVLLIRHYTAFYYEIHLINICISIHVTSSRKLLVFSIKRDWISTSVGDFVIFRNISIVCVDTRIFTVSIVWLRREIALECKAVLILCYNLCRK